MNSSPPLSRVIEQPSTPESQSFDYAVLNTETRIVVQQRTSEIKTLMRQTAKDTISIGQKLTEVKQQLGHGEFGKWLKAEFNWGITTAWKLMKVAEVFKFSQCENLNIAASALYLLAAPSTSEEARTEALERATLGEAITHSSAKSIITRHKNTAKPKGDKTVTFDVPSETVKWAASPTAMPRKVAQTVEVQSAAVVEQSEDKLPEEETEVPAQFQVSNHSHGMDPAANSGNYPPQDQAQMEIQSLFEIGHRICITDFGQQNPKWIGEVAEVKEATATNIKVIITILLQPST